MELKGRTHFLDPSLKNKYLVVWWYGAIRAGYRDKTQPLLDVQMREIDFNDHSRLGGYHHIQISVAHAGIAYLGSIWRCDGARSMIKTYSSLLEGRVMRRFTINCDKPGWDVYSVKNSLEAGRSNLLSSERFSIVGDKQIDKMSRSRMLHFKVEGSDKTVLVPCMEWFNKMYGHNDTLRRWFMLYPLEEVLRKATYIPKV